MVFRTPLGNAIQKISSDFHVKIAEIFITGIPTRSQVTSLMNAQLVATILNTRLTKITLTNNPFFDAEKHENAKKTKQSKRKKPVSISTGRSL